jgi:hypothetical protein
MEHSFSLKNIIYGFQMVEIRSPKEIKSAMLHPRMPEATRSPLGLRNPGFFLKVN